MERAVNPTTGEVVFLVDNQWVAPSQTAKNAAGANAYLVNDAWVAPTESGGYDYADKRAAIARAATPTSNPLVGMAGRAAAGLGSLIEGVARVAEPIGDFLETKLPLSGISPEDIKNKRQLEPMFKVADQLRDWDASLGYQPSTKLSDLSSNPLKVIPFIAERVISSSPDMAAAVLASPAYMATRTNEILNERIKNDSKNYEDLTVKDVTLATAAAVAEAQLERYTTKRLLKGKEISGKNAGTRILKEGAIQSATGGAEEGIGYLGGTFDTKRGIDKTELLESIAEGAIVEGGLGASVRGVREYRARGKDAEATAKGQELSPEDQAEREKEQQTAAYMRAQRDEQEAAKAAQAPFIGQKETPEGQFGLNLEGGKRVAPTETVQGGELPERKAGFDAYGRPKTEEPTPAAPMPMGSTATPMTQALDATQSTQQHRAERDGLLQQLNDLPDTPESRAVGSQMAARVRELNKLIKTAESVPAGTQGALPVVPSAEPTQATPAAPEAPAPTTSALVRAAGIPASAPVAQQLKKLDLTQQADRTAAAQFIATALANKNVRPETKAAIQAFYDQHIAQPAPAGQGGLDLGEPQPLVQETPPAAPPVVATPPTAPAAPPVAATPPAPPVVPPTPPSTPPAPPMAPAVAVTPDTAPPVIDATVWRALGIGPTAAIRRNVDVNGKDITDPTDGAFVRQALEAYRDASSSDRIKANIDRYLARFPLAATPAATPAAKPAATPAATPAPKATKQPKAAKATKAATPAAPTPPPPPPKSPVEQRVESDQIESWALTANPYVGNGDVVYADATKGLVRVQLNDGTMQYRPMTAAMVIKEDISQLSYVNQGTLGLTPQDVRELIEARNLIEARENALLAQFPDGPFTNATNNVVATENVDPRYTQYLTALMQKLGMGDVNLFLVAGKDLENNKDKYHLHGAYGTLTTAGNSDSRNGMLIPFGPRQDTLAIYIDPTMPEAKALETIAHELGHGIEYTSFVHAPQATKYAIVAEYTAWKAAARKMNVEQFMNSLRNRESAAMNLANASPATLAAPARNITDGKGKPNFESYWASFPEWFADNVSRWATTDAKATSLVAKFFQAIAKQMRALAAAVTGKQFNPATSVADFLNSMSPANPVMWQGAVADRAAGNVRVRYEESLAETKPTAPDTPEFKKWFGDSKVVDDNGQPLRVYHGTNKTQQGQAFTSFDTYGSEYGLMGQGSYFTDNPDIASSYTKKGRGESPTVYPVYLSLKNPIDMSAKADASNWGNTFSDVDFASVKGTTNEAYLRAVEEHYADNEYPKYEAAQAIQEGIMSMGHDGITHVGGGRFKGQADTARHQVYIAFEPNQIKSAYNQTPTDVNDISGEESLVDQQQMDESTIVQTSQSVNTPPGQITPATWNNINQAKSQPQRTALTQFAAVQAQNDISWTDWFRQKTVDVFAPIATKLGARFDQGVRDSFGDVNPVQFIRQAFDHARVALDVFRQGGLRMNKDGFWESYQLKDANGKEMSAQQVVKDIAELAKKNNEAYNVTKGKVATVLEGMRLSDLRKENAEKERLAKAFEAQGDFDKADKMREKKILLHMSFAEIDALEQVFNASPEIQEIQRIMNTSRESAVDAMITSGRISKDRGDLWKAVTNYVPFDRENNVYEDPSLTQRPTRKGISALGELPALRGSLKRPVVNTVDSYMNTMAWMVDQSMRNSAAVRVLNLMASKGVDMAKKLPSMNQATNTHMVVPKLYEKGEPVYFELHSPYDFAAFVQAPEIQSGALKLLGASSRLLRTTVTATPMFAVKQVVDDAQRVMFYSGVKNPRAALATLFWHFPHAWFGAWFGKQSGLEKKLVSLGIIGDYDFNPTNPIETIEYQTKAVKRSAVGWAVNKLEQVTKASDMAARMAVYEQTLKETGDPAVAQVRARELINFNRRGSSKAMNVLSHTVPFFNAYAQGLDLMYRGVSGKDASSGLNKRAARNYFISRMMIMTGMGFLYALAMSDDEQYEDLTDEVRDRNWILPKSINDSFPVKLSVPAELGFIFKSIPERIVSYMKSASKGEDQGVGRAVMDTLGDALKTYGNVPIPPILKSAIENTANYSFFTHRELVPKAMQERPAALQYTSNTSELGKAIGKAGDVSPIKVDNWIRGTFGLMGASGLLVTDAMMNPARPDRSLAQIPFMSIALVNPAGSRVKDEFYDFRQKITEAVAAKNMLEKENPVKYAEFVQKNYHLLAAAPYVNQKLKVLSELRAAKEMFTHMPASSMTSAEKRKNIDEINKIEKVMLSDMRTMRSAIQKAGPK